VSAILESPLTWLLAAVIVVVAALRLGGRRARLTASRQNDDADAARAEKLREAHARLELRAASVDALAEAILLTDGDGRVLDCNSSALTLFNRHRGELEGQPAVALRRFDGIEQSDPHRIASERAIWVGEGWVRLPDGAMRLCHVRVIAIRDARAVVLGFAESFRDVVQDQAGDQVFRDLLYGVRAFESATTTSSETLSAVREDLRVLSEAFRDLDHVLRQYERLLPSLSPDDPLAEAIAGAAHDARTAVAAVGVPDLLDEIPRALTRLRGNLLALSSELQARSTAPNSRDELRPTGARRE
jgi:PAS domain S-box-containing protein